MENILRNSFSNQDFEMGVWIPKQKFGSGYPVRPKFGDWGGRLMRSDPDYSITSARSTKLNIVMKTAVALLLGERREALSSTTRNHSSSQLHKGASQNRGPPTLNRDEDPCWVWEDPLQRVQALPPTKSNAFYHQTH